MHDREGTARNGCAVSGSIFGCDALLSVLASSCEVHEGDLDLVEANLKDRQETVASELKERHRRLARSLSRSFPQASGGDARKGRELQIGIRWASVKRDVTAGALSPR